MKRLTVLLVLGLTTSLFAGSEITRKKNAATVVCFPLINAAGAYVTGEDGGANADTEYVDFSDANEPVTFTDLTDEIHELGTTGIYYVELTAGEMNYDYITLRVSSDNSLGTVINIRTWDLLIDAVWDEAVSGHTGSGSTGKKVKDAGDGASVSTNTIQGATSSTVQLAAAEPATADYATMTVVITSGTGVGQARTITTYTGATDTADVSPNWTVTPVAGDGYIITPTASVIVNSTSITNIGSEVSSSGGTTILDTTVSSATDAQTFVIATGVTQDDVYNGWLCTVTDADGDNIAEPAIIRDYVSSSKTITLDRSLSFTPSNADVIKIFPSTKNQGKARIQVGL